jgi:ankyrin repeat protein
VKQLLEKENIDLNSKDNKGRTPPSWAVEKQQGTILRQLVEEENIDLNSKDNNGQTPLFLAVENEWERQ